MIVERKDWEVGYKNAACQIQTSSSTKAQPLCAKKRHATV